MKTLISLIALTIAAQAEVRIESVPENGVQPQVIVAAGTTHLIYLRGAPSASDVRYVSRGKGAKDWSAPIAVNSQPGSAIAMGTIRGAQAAVGADGRLHVVWNGNGKTAGLFYTRLLPGTNKFEPQRDLMDGAGLDGGASIAADAKGAVYAVWHGAGATLGEPERVVRVRKSTDHGATFSPPTVAGQPGVCACCSLRALAAADGLTVFYRAAHTVTQRDMTLLSSHDRGATFRAEPVGLWKGNTCPMSSASLLPTTAGTRMAWETDAQIFTALPGKEPLALGKGKHPSLATNTRGETLIVWAVGTGWNRGGTLEWTVLGADGRPTAQRGSAPGIPTWSFPSVFADDAGDFIILR